MKTIAIIKKATVLAISVFLVLLMTMAVIPAGADESIVLGEKETTDLRTAIDEEKTLVLTSDANFKIDPYEKLVVQTNGFDLTVSTSRGYKVTTIDNGDGETVTVYAYKDLGDKLSTMNISLSGNITMMFYFTELPEMSSTDYFEIKVPTQNGSYSLKKAYRDNFEEVGNRYLLRISVAAAQQTDKVSFQLIKNGGADKGRLRMYSVKDYADKVLDFAAQYNPNAADTPDETQENKNNKVFHEMKNAVTNMLNYGAQAQIVNNYKTDNLANKDLYVDSTANPVTNMTAEHLYGTENLEFKVPTNENEDVFKNITPTPILDSTIAIHFTFDYEGDRANYIKATVERDGMEDGPADTKVKKVGNKYYVGISNIPADYFDKMYTVTLELDGKKTVIEYSVLSYVLDVMNNHEQYPDLYTKEVQDAAKSMYLYYTFMKQYITRNDKDEDGNSTAHVPGPKDCDHYGRTQEIVTQAATCVEEGITSISCADCGIFIKNGTVSLDSESHDYRTHDALTATCSTYGRDAYKSCKLCGQLADMNDVAIDSVPELTLGDTHTGNLKDVEAVTATCSTYGHAAYKKCADCDAYYDGEKYYDEIPDGVFTLDANNHGKINTVAAKTPTCLTNGWDEYKKCADCNAILTADGVTKLDGIPTATASHTFETVEATDSTCVLSGHEAYQTCNTCDQLFNVNGEVISRYPVKDLDPDNHVVADVAFAAPTNKEDGWEAHKICEHCGKVWSTDGEELDAVPSIAKIVPTTNKYFGYETFKNKTIGGSAGSLWNPTAPSADRTYVRFSRAGKSDDGNLGLLSGNTEVTGQYMVIKYRTDHASSVAIWANTEDNGHDGGKANFGYSVKPDGKWHLEIIDLSSRLSTYVKPNKNGEYIVQWARIDALDGEATAGYFDIAYIAFTDDISKISSIVQEGDRDLCSHVVAKNPVYADLGENHSTQCAVCGETMLFNHIVATAPVWNTENYTYSSSCECGKTFVSNATYVSEPYSAGATSSAKIDVMDGFVRYTKSGSSDPYIHIYASGTAITGKYAIIKYRASKEGLSYNNSFVGSAAGTHKSTANSGCDSNTSSTQSGSFAYDGENWQYLIFEAKSQCFVANPDGTYSFGFLRFGFGNLADGDYLDVDEIAFFDNLYAAERYLKGNDAVCKHGSTKQAWIADEQVLRTTCYGCGEILSEGPCPHSSASYTWDTEAKLYTATCSICSTTLTKDMLYKTEGTVDANQVASSGGFLTASQQDGFVRYTPTKSADDPYFYPVRNNTSNVTGQYMVIKYRITNNDTNMTLGAIYASSAAHGRGDAQGNSGDGSNSAISGTTLYADGEWHYLIITPDLNKNNTFTANADGTYTWKYLRIAIGGFAAFDGSCYFDIEEIAFADNRYAAERYAKGDEAVCTHAEKSYVWDNVNDYTITCAGCGQVTVSDMLYKTEAKTTALGTSGSWLTATQEDGFVRYKANAAADDPYFYPFDSNTANVTGQYMVIRYRLIDNNSSSGIGAIYASSAAHGQGGASGNSGDDKNYTLPKDTNLIGDGNWRTIIITPDLFDNETFTPNIDGTYTWKYLRIAPATFTTFDSTTYLDIDEIAFADNEEVAQLYADKYNSAYKWFIDNGSNTGINGVAAALPFVNTNSAVDVVGKIDMAESGAINATNGVAVGGWFVTPGGTASYKYRITSVDGVAVENPSLIDGWTGGSNPGITNVGISQGYGESCGIGAGFQDKKWLNLKGYEGKKVNIEIVAITNSGKEITFLVINNVNVAAAAAE